MGKRDQLATEQLADSEAETPAEVNAELRRMGDPLAWWSGRGR